MKLYSGSSVFPLSHLLLLLMWWFITADDGSWLELVYGDACGHQSSKNVLFTATYLIISLASALYFRTHSASSLQPWWWLHEAALTETEPIQTKSVNLLVLVLKLAAHQSRKPCLRTLCQFIRKMSRRFHLKWRYMRTSRQNKKIISHQGALNMYEI